MLSIRLSQVGKKNKKMFRITVAENTKDPFGRALEILGHYNPHSKEFVIKEDRVKELIAKGAQATNTVHNLLLKHGIITGKKAKSVSISKKNQEKLDKVKTNKVKIEADKKAKQEAEKAEAEKVVPEPVETPEATSSETPEIAQEVPVEAPVETPKAEDKVEDKVEEQKKAQ